MDLRETARLVEEAISAWRPRSPEGKILVHPAWADLRPEDRERVYEETLASRAIEAAIDPDGISTTARAVLARIGTAT